MAKRILIIGAGITGLYTSFRLIEQGFDVILCERAAGLRHEGGGLGIWPTGVKLLHHILGRNTVDSLTGQLKTLVAGVDNQPPIAHIPINIFSGINGLLNRFIVRGELQHHLASKVPESIILYNKKCCGIKQSDTYASALFTDGTEIKADCIIGADGIFSTVRQHLFPDYQLKDTGLIVVGGIIDFKEGYQPQNNFTFGLNRLSMLMPVSNHRYYSFLARPFDGKKPKEPLDLFSDWSTEVDIILDKLRASLLDNNRKQHFFCQHVWTADPYPKWFNDRVVLLGESAHPISPLLGLGTSLCLQGAESLIHYLKMFPNDLNQAFSQYQSIQDYRLRPLLALENVDCERLVDKRPETFDTFVNLVKTTDPAVLFAPLIQALIQTTQETIDCPEPLITP